MTPEGWETTSLGSVAALSGGTTPSRSVEQYWADEGVFWATPTDVTALPLGQMYIDSTRDSVTQQAVEQTGLKVLEPGAVLMTSRASIGDAVINKVAMATNQGFCNFLASPKCDSLFLAYWLRHNTEVLKSIAGGSTFLEVSKTSLTRLEIQLPPLLEQKKIAEILGSVDEAIQATQAVIDQTRKVKQGLLQQLLTRGIGHTRFKQTEIGQIPESWEVRTAYEVCSRISVGIVVTPSRYYVDSGVPCFRSANVQEGHVHDADWVYISEASNELHAKSRLRSGDVLVVRTGYPGTSCVVPEKYDGSNCIDVIFARPNQDAMLPEFLSGFINSDLGKKQVLAGQGGLAQQHFNVGALNKMALGVPSVAEQRQIVDRIGSVQDSTSAGQGHLDQLNRLKRGLMQDLLRGRVRVNSLKV